MMKNIFTKIKVLVILFIYSAVYADPIVVEEGTAPPQPYAADATTSGGTGGDGPGAPALPLDNYVILLVIVALFLIVYFARKKQSKVA